MSKPLAKDELELVNRGLQSMNEGDHTTHTEEMLDWKEDSEKGRELAQLIHDWINEQYGFKDEDGDFCLTMKTRVQVSYAFHLLDANYAEATRGKIRSLMLLGKMEKMRDALLKKGQESDAE